MVKPKVKSVKIEPKVEPKVDDCEVVESQDSQTSLINAFSLLKVKDRGECKYCLLSVCVCINIEETDEDDEDDELSDSSFIVNEDDEETDNETDEDDEDDELSDSSFIVNEDDEEIVSSSLKTSEETGRDDEDD